MLKLTKDQARHYLIGYHWLDRRRPKNQVLALFDRLRTIQYDPLKLVGRNADLVLKARLADFHPDDLAGWLYHERILIDGWDKMMNIYPAADRSAMTPVAGRYARAIEAKADKLLRDDFDRLVDQVRGRLARGETLKNNQLTKELNMGSQGYYTPVHILDYLFHRGEARILHKTNTQKTYAMAKPARPGPADEAFFEWYIYRRIEAVGLIRRNLNDAWLGYYTWEKAVREPAIKRLLERGLIREVMIEGVNSQFLIPSHQAEQLDVKPAGEPQVRLLAPLDNLLWDRRMIEELFDFHYRWEVYVPAAQRRWGYYVLPILYGDRLIGRLEPERPERSFKIKQIWWQDGIVPPREALAEEVASFDAFVTSADPAGAGP